MDKYCKILFAGMLLLGFVINSTGIENPLDESWQFNVQDSIDDAIITQDHVYIVYRNEPQEPELIKKDLSGNTVWNVDLGERYSITGATVEKDSLRDNIYIGSSEKVFMLDPETGDDKGILHNPNDYGLDINPRMVETSIDDRNVYVATSFSNDRDLIKSIEPGEGVIWTYREQFVDSGRDDGFSAFNIGISGYLHAGVFDNRILRFMPNGIITMRYNSTGLPNDFAASESVFAAATNDGQGIYGSHMDLILDQFDGSSMHALALSKSSDFLFLESIDDYGVLEKRHVNNGSIIWSENYFDDNDIEDIEVGPTDNIFLTDGQEYGLFLSSGHGYDTQIKSPTEANISDKQMIIEADVTAINKTIEKSEIVVCSDGADCNVVESISVDEGTTETIQTQYEFQSPGMYTLFVRNDGSRTSDVSQFNFIPEPKLQELNINGSEVGDQISVDAVIENVPEEATVTLDVLGSDDYVVNEMVMEEKEKEVFVSEDIITIDENGINYDFVISVEYLDEEFEFAEKVSIDDEPGIAEVYIYPYKLDEGEQADVFVEFSNSIRYFEQVSVSVSGYDDEGYIFEDIELAEDSIGVYSSENVFEFGEDLEGDSIGLDVTISFESGSYEDSFDVILD